MAHNDAKRSISAGALSQASLIGGVHLVICPRERCEELRSACLSVCLLAYLKICMSKLREIFYICHLLPWLGPVTSLQYVMYFRFCGCRHVFTQWAKYRYRLGVCDVANYSPCTRGEVCYRRLPSFQRGSFAMAWGVKRDPVPRSK